MQRDTLEYEVPQPDGEWLGNGYGSLKGKQLMVIKGNGRFPNFRRIYLEIFHPMRKNGLVDGIVELEGITDVG